MRKQGSGIAALLDQSPKGSKKGFGSKSLEIVNDGKVYTINII